jgi:hypothetical protein
MDGREKTHSEKYKEITDDWNFYASCALKSLHVQDKIVSA